MARKTDTLLGLLVKLRDYFTGPEKWTKGTIRNGHGQVCLLGGIREVLRQEHDNPNYNFAVDGENMSSELSKAIRQEFGDQYSGIPGFNDHWKTEFKDIQVVINRAVKNRHDVLAKAQVLEEV
jgi:hypothetical protein